MKIFIPMAFEVSTQIFNSIRDISTNGIQASTSLALSAACTIVAFQLIKLSYDVMSDEQQAGFGGIRLWQILRPILIIFAIKYASVLFGWFDYGVNYFASNVGGKYSATNCANVVSATLKAAKTKIAGEYADNNSVQEGIEIISNSRVAGDDAAAEWQKAVTEQKQRGGFAGFLAGLGSSYSNGLYTASETSMANAVGNAVRKSEVVRGEEKVKQGITETEKAAADGNVADAVGSASEGTKSDAEIESQVSAISSAAQKLSKVQSQLENEALDFIESIKDGSFFLSIAYWLYDLAFFVLNAMVEIILAILTVMFPWTLVLSLLSHFKDATWKYIATYVHVSFWKVTASIINWTVVTAVPTMSIYVASEILPNISGSSQATKLGVIAGNGLAIAMVFLAGFVCLTKVAAITSMYIPNASADSTASDSAMGMISTGATGAAKAVVQAPGKVATVATGGVGRAVGAAGGVVKGAAKGAGNALGKVAGGATP